MKVRFEMETKDVIEKSLRKVKIEYLVIKGVKEWFVGICDDENDRENITSSLYCRDKEHAETLRDEIMEYHNFS